MCRLDVSYAYCPRNVNTTFLSVNVYIRKLNQANAFLPKLLEIADICW